MARILLTWMGRQDPQNDFAEHGPILSLLKEQDENGTPFDVVYILWAPRTAEEQLRVDSLESLIAKSFDATAIGRYRREVLRLSPHDRIDELVDCCEGLGVECHALRFELVSPDDDELVLAVAMQAVEAIRTMRENTAASDEYACYLSPGTPSMRIAWRLLRDSGVLPATLITAFEGRIGKGARFRSRELPRLSLAPSLQAPGLDEATPAAEQKTSDALRRRNETLEEELVALRVQLGLSEDGEIREPIDLKTLPDRLRRFYIEKAWKQTGFDIAECYRLLGYNPKGRAIENNLRDWGLWQLRGS